MAWSSQGHHHGLWWGGGPWTARLWLLAGVQGVPEVATACLALPVLLLLAGMCSICLISWARDFSTFVGKVDAFVVDSVTEGEVPRGL